VQVEQRRESRRAGGDEAGRLRIIDDGAGVPTQILLRGAPGGLEFHGALEDVQFRQTFLHRDPKHRAEIRHVQLRRADAKSPGLGRHLRDQPTPETGCLAGRNDPDFRRPFDGNPRSGVKDNLRQP
jgi:hypothetical protein